MHSRKSRPGKRGADDGGRTLADALPDALAQALDAYRRHAGSDPGEDAKAFQQHQAACKAALQHIETLLKLQDAVAREAADGGTSSAEMLARAQAAVDAYTEENEE